MRIYSRIWIEIQFLSFIYYHDIRNTSIGKIRKNNSHKKLHARLLSLSYKHTRHRKCALRYKQIVFLIN